jgi:hypothetical protein
MLQLRVATPSDDAMTATSKKATTLRKFRILTRNFSLLILDNENI